jgi:hypothetical protein
MTREVSLLVNGQPITLDYFVQGFIDHTVGGMLSSLEGVGDIQRVELSIEGDDVTVNLNGAHLSTNPFVSKIIRNTVRGMVSSLKGVGETDSVRVIVQR